MLRRPPSRSCSIRFRSGAFWSLVTDREITRIHVSERKRPKRYRPDRYPERTMWLFHKFNPIPF